MPHTWIVWVYAQYVHSHIATQEMSAVRMPSCIENFHIFLEGLRKHFLIICLPWVQLPRHRKIKKNFRNEQHPIGTLQIKCYNQTIVAQYKQLFIRLQYWIKIS